ncbi:MAG: DUF6236 family protein [Candidatus Gastranaerophilales bacterium]|nr:DUF6236 family protein [Candidatus Gastranaerophilales bacterium]
MNDSALYYPYIKFHDTAWIKAMSLFYDNIYRIVPIGFDLNDQKELKPLIKNKIIGLEFSNLSDYRKVASEKFLSKIDSFKEKALTFRHNNRFNNISRIHSDKIDYKLIEFFRNSGYKQTDEWLDMPEHLASLYMLFLSNEISQSNNLSLITDKTEFWTAINFYKSEENITPIENRTNLPHYYKERKEDVLFSIILDNIMPLNISEISSSKILKFREKRIVEIKALREAITHLNSKLSNIQDYEILRSEIATELSGINRIIEDFRKSTDIMGNINWGSLFTSTATGFGVGSGVCLINQDPIIVGSIGIIATLTSYNNDKSKQKQELLKKPLSCLALMRKDFNLNTIDKLKEIINKDRFEFIND